MQKEQRIIVNLIGEYQQWQKVTIPDSYTICVRGYAFIGDQYYPDKALAKYLSDCIKNSLPDARVKMLEELIPKLNGCWSLVYNAENYVLAAVDRVRSIPLFYTMENDVIIISDDAKEVLKSMSKAELDDICLAEFLVTSYVTGKDTLYRGLYQVQPGEILKAKITEKGLEIDTERYFRYIFGNYFEASEEELEDELSDLLHRAFARYANALKGKTPVIPVSGGWDSRLLAAMLKRCGVDNAICFSYGRPGNPEAEASRAVAKALGYQWLFCSYDEASWYKWYHEEQCRVYMDYASNFSSIACIQDWPAVREMLNNELYKIENDKVFMPGLCFDMLAGIHLIPKPLLLSEMNKGYKTLLPESVLSSHYKLWDWRKKCPEFENSFLKRINEILPEFSDEDKSSALRAYETWFFEARPCKFVINSVRAYEFFNSQWLLPWWDYEIVDFFLRVKLESRAERKLVGNTLLHKIYVGGMSDLANIPFLGLQLPKSDNQTGKPNTLKLKSILYTRLKKVTPNFIKNRYSHFLNNDSNAFYGMISGIEKHQKIRDIIYDDNNLPDFINSILYSHKNKPIRSIGINGFISLDHIRHIVSY